MKFDDNIISPLEFDWISARYDWSVTAAFLHLKDTVMQDISIFNAKNTGGTAHASTERGALYVGFASKLIAFYRNADSIVVDRYSHYGGNQVNIITVTPKVFNCGTKGFIDEQGTAFVSWQLSKLCLEKMLFTEGQW